MRQKQKEECEQGIKGVRIGNKKNQEIQEKNREILGKSGNKS